MEAEKISRLVEAARKGDKDAFEKLYYATNKSGYFLAYNITHDEEAAKDILQDSYINAFTNIKSLKKKENFQKWFNVIVVNGSKNFIVKNKPNLFSEYDGDIDTPFDDEMMNDDFIPEKSLDNKEIRETLKKIIDSLPDDQRLCVLMYYYEQMSTKSIAKQLEVAEGTVRSRLYYGRLHIKKKVEALEKDGIKLYGAMPVPLTIWALQASQEGMLASSVSAAIYGGISSSVSFAAGASAAAIGTKLLVGGISAAIIITGGVLGINYINSRQPQQAVKTELQTESTETQPAQAEVISPTIAVENTEPTVQTSAQQTTEAAEAETQSSEQPVQQVITTYYYPAETSEQATQAPTLPADREEEKKVTFDYKVYENKIIIEKYTGDETNVVVPEFIDGMAVSEISEKAFADNKYIKSVEIPNGIDEIKDGLFTGCSDLERVALPDTVKRIGIYAFAYCDSLTDVNIPSTVKEIGYCAFRGCTVIKNISLPLQTESIGINAFADTPNLTLQCYKNSFAQQYAERYSLRYNTI